MLFKALALFFASMALAKSNSEGVFLTIKSTDGNLNAKPVTTNVCHEHPVDPSGSISSISITGLKAPDPKCIFYSESGCRGGQTRLKKGNHELTAPIHANSFKCTE